MMEQTVTRRNQKTNPERREYPATAPAKSKTGVRLGTASNVLIIDDSPTVRAVVELALHCEGYKTASFPDGLAAMEWLSRPDAFIPDLIFIDIGLPKLDGYQIIQLFKRNSRFDKTVWIMLSQRDGTVDRLKGKVAGAHKYLTKPFTVQSICEAAHTCLLEAGSTGTSVDRPDRSAPAKKLDY